MKSEKKSASAALAALAVVTSQAVPSAANVYANCVGLSRRYVVNFFSSQNLGPIDGISADLQVECLGIQNPYNGFIAHEIWLTTQANVSKGYTTWVET